MRNKNTFNLGVVTALVLSIVMVIPCDLFAQNLTISGGYSYSLVVCSSGKVYAWGSNAEGQIGKEETSPGVFVDRAAANYDTPQVLGGLPEIFQVDAGSGGHALGLTCDDQVVAWGANCTGQLGGGAALPGMGTGFSGPCPDISTDPVFVVGIGGVGTLDQVSYVSGSTDASFAITQDGRVASWGQNAQGNLGRVTTGTYTSIPGYVQGDNDGDGIADGDLQDVVFVEGMDYGAYALTANGNIYSWGQDNNGALGRDPGVGTSPPNDIAGLVVDQTGAPLENIVVLSAGDTHGMAIDAFGNVWAWGGDWAGQIGNGDPYHNATDKYAVRVVGGESGETYLGDSDKVIKIAAGQRSSAAVTENGLLYVWGGPSNGSSTGCFGGVNNDLTVAQPSTGTGTAPVLMDVDNVADVSDGDAWFFAIKSDGTVWVDGINDEGQQGVGGLTNTCGWEEITIPSCDLSFPCPDPELVNINVCLGDDWRFDAGTIPPGFEATWTAPDGSTTVQTNPLSSTDLLRVELNVNAITLADLGTYSLEIIDNRPATNRPCDPCPTVNVQADLSLYTATFSDPGDLEYCPSQATCATVNVNGTGSFEWYAAQTGGTSLGSTTDIGTTCIDGADLTEVTGIAPNRTWIAWVEDVSSVAGTVRPLSERSSFSSSSRANPVSYPISGNVTDDANRRTLLQFDAQTSFDLTAVTVQVAGWNSSTVRIHVLDASATSLGYLEMTGISVSGGATQQVTITGNVNVPAGTGYYLFMETVSGDAGVIWYQNGPANWFPQTYSVSGVDVVRIQSNVGFDPGYGPWSSPSFFDWEVETGSPYPCGRVPVQIVEDCPPCSQPSDIIFARASPETLCEGDDFNALAVNVTTPAAAQNTEFYISFSKDGGTFSTPLGIGAAQNPTGTFPGITGVDPTDAGTYTIRVEDGNAGSSSCYFEEDFVLNVDALPDLTATDPAAVCAPNTVDITGAWVDNNTTGATITYHDGTPATAGNQITNQAAITTSGTYYVLATNGTCTDEVDITATINPSPTFTVTDPAAQCAGTVDLSGTVSSLTPGGATLSYHSNMAGTSANVNPVSTSGTYYIKATASGCETIQAVNVVIDEQPDLAVTDPAAVCAPNTVDITGAWVDNNTTGATITYHDGTPATAGNQITNQAAITASGTYYVLATNGTCTDEAPVNVTVNDIPDLAITDPAAVCEPNTVDITGAWVDNNTTGGTVTYHDGTPATAGNQITNQAAITTSGTYYVLVDNLGCTDEAAVNVVINPLPEVSISGDQTICDDGSYNIPITIDVATTANYTINYTGPSGAGSVGPGAGPFTIPVTPADAGTYTLTSVTDGNNCSGTASGSVIIDVHPAITVSDLGFTCDKFAGTYTVDLNIQDGVPGYTVDGEADSNTPFATAGTFTSQPITIDGSGSGNYSFTITDASGCTSGTEVINGTYDCNCSITGSISAVDDEFCEGEDTDILVNMSGGVVGDYTVDYTFTPTSTGTPVNSTANFTGDQTGVVLTNITESGTVTLNSITDSDCGTSFTLNVPITVNPLPEAELTGGTTICDDGSATLTVNLTNPTTGPYDISYTGNPGGTLSGSLAITVPAADAGTYTLTGITDANTCVGTITGSAQVVDVYPNLAVSNTQVACDKFAGTFTVSFDIAGGTVNYTIDGEQDNNTVQTADGTFTSAPIAIPATETGNYNFTVTDASGCTANTDVPVAGPYDCGCSITGSISAVDDEFCEGEDTDILVNMSGGVVGDYTVDYTFTPTSTGTPVNSTANFTGDQTGVVLTNITESGTVTLNSITDSDCGTSFTLNVPITVNPLPEAELTGGTTICDDGSATLTVNLTNPTTGPYDISYTGNPGGTLSGSLAITVPAADAGTYTLTGITDANTCVGTITGSAQVVDVYPNLSVSNQIVSCDKFSGTFTVSFDIAGGTVNYTIDGEQDNNTVQTADGTFTSAPIAIPATETGNYNFTVTDASGCTANTDVPVTGPYDCSCSITGAIDAVDDEFCVGGNTDITVDIAGGAVGDYTVDYTFTPTSTGVPATGSANFTGDQTGATLTNVSEAGTIRLTRIADSDCGSGFGQDVIINTLALPTATISGGGAVCNDATDVTTVSIAFTGAAPYNVTYTNGTPVTVTANSSPYTFDVTSSDAGTYTVTALSDDNTCVATATELNGSADVTTIALPEVDITGGTTICNDGVDAATITITGTIGTGEWEGTYSTPSGTANYITSGGVFSFNTMEVGTFTLLTVTDNGTTCDNTASGSTVVDATELPAVTGITGNASTCPPLTTTESFTAVDDATAGPSTSYVWSVANGAIVSGQGTNQIDVDFTGLTGPQTITVTPVGCAQGASASTSIDVQVEENPSVSLTDPSPLCFGGDVTWEATVSGTGNVAPTISWTVGGVTQPSDADTMRYTAFRQDVVVQVTSNYGCSSNPTISATVTPYIVTPPVPAIDINDDHFCETQGPEDLIVSVIEDPDSRVNYSYRWFRDNILINTTSTDGSMPVNTSGNYRVEVSDNICQDTAIVTQTVIVDEDPIVDAGPAVQVDQGETGFLNGSTTVIGTIEWTPNNINLDSPYWYETSFKSNNLVIDQVMTLTVVNGECISSDYTTVTIRPNVEVPNVFTPNHNPDGMNDLWEIVHMEYYPNAKVRVFNRWGNEVWRNDEPYYQHPWDGTRNGKKMPIATYYYIIELSPDKDPIQGSVTIIR